MVGGGDGEVAGEVEVEVASGLLRLLLRLPIYTDDASYTHTHTHRNGHDSIYLGRTHTKPTRALAR